jgi:hypothetical protein
MSSLLRRKVVSRIDLGVSETRNKVLVGTEPEARSAIKAAPSGLSVSLAANYTLTENDDGNRYFCSANPTITVPSNLPPSFGIAIFGAASISPQAGVSITDNRLVLSGTTNYSCVLIPGVAANSYIIEGNK